MFVDDRLHLDITVANLGLRLHVPEADLDAYRRAPEAYVALRFESTEAEVRRYLATAGTIQCGHIRSNGLRCRNIHGVHAAPGRLEFPEWVALDRAGWYCNVHGG